MPLFPLLLTLVLLTAGTAHVPAATTASSKSKSKGKTSTSSSTSKPQASEMSETADKPKTETSKDGSTSKSGATAKKSETAVAKEDTPKQEPRPAAVSTMSIEEIRDFDKYPKQVQSLVQSSLALTHLELRYMYGSHEPNKGGMDCSGTIYHVLHFQGLKDVPRQSDEMAMWVEKKSQLHLTPTATSFDSPEFADLKPGDLLFWTNTTATTRKLPVTHVMIYIGKRKEDGKRIIFGASDGRSFSGMRRSGVSVFDFNLPRAEGTARLHGYGPAPGLLPAEVTLASAAPKPATPSATSTPAETAPVKEEPKKEPSKVVAAAPEAKANEEPKEEAPKAATTPPYVKVKKKEEPAKVAAVPDTSHSPPPEAKAEEESKPGEEPPAIASITKAKAPPAMDAKIEVRKAMPAVTENDGTAEAEEETPTSVVAAKSAMPESSSSTKSEPKKVASSGSKPKTTTSKPKTSTTTKKKSVQVSSKRRTPAPPPKSQVEQVFDRAVNSVRRAFR